MKSQLYADIVNKLALDFKSKMDSTKLDTIKEEIECANSSQREERSSKSGEEERSIPSSSSSEGSSSSSGSSEE
jgi:hypothetical protein